MTTQNTLT